MKADTIDEILDDKDITDTDLFSVKLPCEDGTP